MILVLEETNRHNWLSNWFLILLFQHSCQNQTEDFMEKNHMLKILKAMFQ